MGMTKKYRSLTATVAMLALLSLGACNSMMGRDNTTGTSGTGSSSADSSANSAATTPSPVSTPVSPSGGTNTNSDVNMPASTPPADAASAHMPPATPSTTGAAGDMTSISAYGVVQAIDPVPRSQQNMAADAGGTMPPTSGGSTAAATGGAGSDMVYRVTVRLDDGTMKAVTQETTPTYQIGDRVRLASGTIQRQ